MRLRDNSEGYLLTARAASGMEAAGTRSGLYLRLANAVGELATPSR